MSTTMHTSKAYLDCLNNRKTYYRAIITALTSNDPSVLLAANILFLFLPFIATPAIAHLIYDYMSNRNDALTNPVDANIDFFNTPNLESFSTLLKTMEDSSSMQNELPIKLEAIKTEICKELNIPHSEL